MEHIDHVADYAHKIIKENIYSFWDSLLVDDYEAQGLNIPEIRAFKQDLISWQIHLVAKVCIIRDAGYDIKKLIPVEFGLYNLYMAIMPETIEKVTLITKYINGDLPYELILPLIRGMDE